MKKSGLNQLVLAGMFAALLVPAAYPAERRCDVPPYGGTIAKFQAFVKNFGQLAAPAMMLSALCNAKYNGASRVGLYNLGFTDGDIDSKDTEDLAVEMIFALKNLADKTK